MCGFFCQAEDGIRDLVRSRGLGDVYKRQVDDLPAKLSVNLEQSKRCLLGADLGSRHARDSRGCLLYTSDAADERSSVDLGGRRIIKKKRSRTKEGGLLIDKKHNSSTSK